MASKRRLIQFPHPGGEHSRTSGKKWSTWDRRHARKFMQFHGQWIDQDERGLEGDLWAWGEWEPESKLVTEFRPSGADGFPSHVWRPYYIVPKGGYERLHNTDPFIFGECFLYSNCNQRGGLKELDRGSVIVFGSKRGEWVLDTVLVVADIRKYKAAEALTALADRAPQAFLDVSGGPLADHGADEEFVLYRGATPSNPVNDMYSFFPAQPAGTFAGFRRPPITVPPDYSNYFSERNGSYPKGYRWDLPDLTLDELRGLWDSLVAQVREAGLVLGTYAELPERREA